MQGLEVARHFVEVDSGRDPLKGNADRRHSVLTGRTSIRGHHHDLRRHDLPDGDGGAEQEAARES